MERFRSLIPGLVVLGLGVLCTYNLYHEQNARIPLLPGFMIFLGPTMIVAGIGICIIRSVAGPAALRSGVLLVTGLMMLLVGGLLGSGV